jgi:hypothetical protein
MSGFPVKRFNWVRTPTFQESSDAWRARRQAARENLEANSSAAWSVFTKANADFATGMASIAASAAVKRAQDAADAQRAQFANSINTLA